MRKNIVSGIVLSMVLLCGCGKNSLDIKRIIQALYKTFHLSLRKPIRQIENSQS